MKIQIWSKQLICLTATICLLASPAVFAQVVTGELGSASATTTIKGDQLPAPEPAFGGDIQ